MEGVLAVERHDPFAQATAILEGSAPSKRANAATATRKKNEAAARAARTQAEKQFQAAPGSALGGGGVGSSKVSESAHRPMIVDLQPAVSLEIMRNSLADPQRIREAFLLQTILDVPVSLRRPPQGPRRAV